MFGSIPSPKYSFYMDISTHDVLNDDTFVRTSCGCLYCIEHAPAEGLVEQQLLNIPVVNNFIVNEKL